MSEPILVVENLQVNYGHVDAVRGVSFEVSTGLSSRLLERMGLERHPFSLRYLASSGRAEG